MADAGPGRVLRVLEQVTQRRDGILGARQARLQPAGCAAISWFRLGKSGAVRMPRISSIGMSSSRNRFEQSHAVVMPQGLDAHVGRPGEVADRQRGGHALSLLPPPGGGKSPPQRLDPPLVVAGSLHRVRPDGHHRWKGTLVMITTELTGVVAEHIAAVNALDTDAIVATFAEDAYVNDARREFAGIEAIRRWVAKEMVGDKVSIDVREVLDHHGGTIVRGSYDGTFDKTNLPEEIVLSNYFSVRDGKIVSLVVIFNQPAGY
jgi:hypothetical protein